MQVISEEKINEIRNAADIVSIISDYIPLKLKGKNYFGLCPFHDDHTPSMSVSKEKQLYKCFVCNKGGNVFSFVKDYENISYIEAIKKVADKVGIPLDIEYKKEVNSKNIKEYEIMEYATKIFQNNLNSTLGIKARKYLTERHIDDTIIKEFRIGLSLDEKNYLSNVLIKKGYDLNILNDLGLINKDGIKTYDVFINRIMIPITNLEGNIVGYTGRIFNNEDMAKYINTKETIIYKKGNILFNYFNAKNYIREEKCAIVVEGNMDVIRMSASGIKNVLALMGTTLTKNQINILKKLRVPIILLLDNDEAGALATLNIGKELINNNIEVNVVRLEEEKDPDEYIIKNGITKFKETIKNAISFLDYELDKLQKNYNLNNIEDMSKYIKDVLKTITNEDNLTKEITIKKLSKEYNIDYDLLKKEINFKQEKVIDKPDIKFKTKSSKYEICVNKLFYYLMSDAKYIEIFNKKLGFLKNRDERNLVAEIESYIDKYKNINIADFLSYIESNDNLKDLVNNINKSIEFESLSDQIFLDYLKVIENILDREEINKLRKELRITTDEKEKIKLTNKITDIVKKRSTENGRD